MTAVRFTRCPNCNELRNAARPCPFCLQAEAEWNAKAERIYLLAGVVVLLALTALVLVVMVQL